MDKKWYGLGLLTALVLLFSFSGCASLGGDVSEAGLRARVEAEWKARKNNEWGAVYDMTIAAYQEKMTRNNFIKRANINVKGYEIKEVRVIEPEKKGFALVHYQMKHLGYTFPAKSKEEWLWENGEWRLNLLPTLKLPFEK
ncbi:MAG: hypothetical protein CSB33_03615 [Desulfobacterales bacterium]|nr:MAG: hypothetical protein CSB33_03615 [Desulfobacterales bacterium]